MNKLLKKYLEITGKKHTNINNFFANIMNDSKGKLIQSLIRNGITDLNQLKQYLRE